MVNTAFCVFILAPRFAHSDSIPGTRQARADLHRRGCAISFLTRDRVALADSL
jgi:hypothetical protein